MSEWSRRCGVEVWAYCLMPNHVHLVAVPGSEDGLRKAIGESHRRYSRHMDFREGWRGHLRQGRFASYPMDEAYLLSAVRYVERNPVRARVVSEAGEYDWSSARSHLLGQEDGFVKVRPMLERVKDWGSFLSADTDEEKARELCRHERTGRPLGSVEFVERLESLVGRIVRREKPGPRPGSKGN